MIEIIGWIAFILGVSAYFLAAKKNILFWLLLIIANCMWAFFGVVSKSASLTLASLTYMGFQVYGFIVWHKEKK